MEMGERWREEVMEEEVMEEKVMEEVMKGGEAGGIDDEGGDDGVLVILC